MTDIFKRIWPEPLTDVPEIRFYKDELDTYSYEFLTAFMTHGLEVAQPPVTIILAAELEPTFEERLEARLNSMADLESRRLEMRHWLRVVKICIYHPNFI